MFRCRQASRFVRSNQRFRGPTRSCTGAHIGLPSASSATEKRRPTSRRKRAPGHSHAGAASLATTEPVAWVIRVAAHLAIDHWRRRRTAARYADSRTELQGRFDDERIDLHRALAKLSRRQRQVVILRFVADLPERTVASVLGCSVGAVKSHGARGLAALRATLTEEDD